MDAIPKRQCCRTGNQKGAFVLAHRPAFSFNPLPREDFENTSCTNKLSDVSMRTYEVLKEFQQDGDDGTNLFSVIT